MKTDCKAFSDLSLEELYSMMVLRQEVFVVEQDCPYLDADGKDLESYHVFGYANNQLVAYTRIVKPGISYPEVSIGRVVSAIKYRSKKYGVKIMEASHQYIQQLFGDVPIRISAQCYLEKFYSDLGYGPTGKEYLEDGIPHMEMLRPVQNVEK